MMIPELLFFICSIPILLFLGYPAIAYLRYVFSGNPVLRSDSFLKPVSIIIAAYKEDMFIKNKLDSFLDPEEWIEGSEIILVVSGATDFTNSILEEYHLPGKLVIVTFPERLSKIQAVNIASELARNEILVFSDCRQKMKKNSLKNLVYNFADASVGAVTATLRDSESLNEESFSRKLLTLIARWDSHTSSALNVYGALYAQRRQLFRKFPENIIFDDLFVVVSTLSQDYRLIQEENAVIYDINFNAYYKNERIRRLARGLLLFITRQSSMFNELKHRDLFRLLIFKYLKLLIPFLVLIQSICIVWFVIKTNNLIVEVALICFLILLFLINKSRTFLTLLIRVNYHMMMMVIKFVFFKERSVWWEKLVTR